MSGKVLLAVLAFGLLAVASVINGTPADPSTEFSASNANASHNLIVGSRLPGDHLVIRQKVYKAPVWYQIVTLEKTFNTTGCNKITQVKALDQKTNGNGATASILSGGPGRKHVTLRFKSKRGYGINFIVELYARPW